MTTHDLKCWPEFFDAIARGEKTFEVRKNDRGFQKGDRLRLLKYDPNRRFGADYVEAGPTEISRRAAAENREPSWLSAAQRAERIECDVTYVLSGWGVEAGYVCMGIKVVQP